MRLSDGSKMKELETDLREKSFNEHRELNNRTIDFYRSIRKSAIYWLLHKGVEQ
jgi:hypothetical protein